MIVCHCHGVSDRAIEAAVRDGADTVGQISERIAAGSGCGGCLPLVEMLVDRARERAKGSGLPVFSSRAA